MLASISDLMEHFSIKEQVRMVILIMAKAHITVNGTNVNYSDTTLNLSQAGTIETGTGTYNAAAGTITGSLQILGTAVTGSDLV